MASFLLLHGPNLNLLGSREPEVYGYTTLDEVNQRCTALAGVSGHRVITFQSNAESQLIEQIHKVSDNAVEFVVMNPAAFTHTSIALRDAMLAVSVPFIEVHLSNVYGRESFRRMSYFSDIAVGIISGFGIFGYELAFRAGIDYLEQKKH